MALTFTATGATPYHYRPATINETLPRLVLRVVIDGIATDAMLDTGGVYLLCHPTVARQLALEHSEGLDTQTVIFREIRVRGTLHRVPLTFVADEGDDFTLDVTAFVPDESYEAVPELPSVLGLYGCMDRLRFAVDPSSDTFYFGPAS